MIQLLVVAAMDIFNASFFDDANADPKHFKASQGLRLLTKTFNLEREGQSLNSEECLKLRQEKLKTLIDIFWIWCKSTQTYANSRLNKAITYAIGQQTAPTLAS
ncbi:IS66 family transposase [Secundilactobacillus muriivasis]